ncbi:neuronal acetylcholine receptor subunit alpha-10-like isoform X2 [Ostrea edulis]|uniref:neuronal acetylcholine receptor subunit alpha-10-like isoform X2 n=1 Tax=Ostrea edulis TaxID=37623 RepID=UPI002095C9FC|nr:neuronal acetylcholine receptor subunit alpha-10-like isoform X2 [Ostrea edulis]
MTPLFDIDLDSFKEVESSTTEKNLYSALFTSYNNEILPRCNHADNVTVTLDMSLREIIALNEREQTLKIKIWVRESWTDCGLSWTPATYGGLTSLSVSRGKVWTPDITLFESVTEGEDIPGRNFYRIALYSDGTAKSYIPAVVVISCSVDVTYFPYDTQTCTLKLGSWIYNGFDIDVLAKGSTGDLTSFVANNEWDVLSLLSERNSVYYQCCPEPYPNVTFRVRMKRKPKFYVLTIIFPCTLVMALAALGFILPADSGEKVSLEVTVLLSLSVFLLLVSDKLPASAETFPIIGLYFTVSMVIVCLSCLLAVWVLYLHFRTESTSPVPLWVKRVFLIKLRFVLCEKPTIEDLDQVEEIEREKDTAKFRRMTPLTHVRPLSEVDVNQSSREPKADNVMDSEQKLEEWRTLARVLDRLFFILYMIISPLVTIAFFGALINN